MYIFNYCLSEDYFPKIPNIVDILDHNISHIKQNKWHYGFRDELQSLFMNIISNIDYISRVNMDCYYRCTTRTVIMPLYFCNRCC